MTFLRPVAKEEIPIQDRKFEVETRISELEDLERQKKIIEEKIRKIEKTAIKNKIHDSLRRIQDINDALVDLQNSTNLIWKRTKQLEYELHEALNTN